MKKMAKIFLIGSVTAFALSLTGPGGDFMWGILKPLAALWFGGFFITNLVANEYAKYDEEQKLKQSVRRKASSGKSTQKNTGRFDAGLLADAAAK
jgi:hypothetical protein